MIMVSIPVSAMDAREYICVEKEGKYNFFTSKNIY